ncbi:Gfo/Idh/MocA family protein [Streptomyces sp. NBC_00268]|uniref:Gfo/Idh/MocA family protein n=1 Tax=Streptomyces sp. NBC_00268 TaxID=2975695 RepID=UPI0022528415|nr:Gfo/Idh/MocA family oxidoreductase [Streptomyces sp. NBC_00268]MCX5181407.1 Gfo/Idh/MocA family oxidoreductase [Streptomyces sp. NBC_00268]
MARSEEVDVVVVTVKVPHHLELIRPALEAGKMVFSEWPLGADLAQAEELADLAQRRGVLTAVCLQARSAPPLRYLRDLVADGYVGRVLSTSMLGSGWIGGATYDDNYAYVLDVTSGATLLSIPFGHSVDALTMVLGEFREVSALIETLRREADARGLHEGWSMARSSTPAWDQHHWTVPHLLRRYVIHCDLGRAVKPLTNRVV